MKSHNLKQLWTHERPQVPEQRSRLSTPYRRRTQSSWHSGIQSWKGRTVAIQMPAFHSFCILSIRKHHHHFPMWVQWHSVFVRCSWTKCTVYANKLWMNMLWHCPFQIKLVEVSSFCYWNRWIVFTGKNEVLHERLKFFKNILDFNYASDVKNI